MTDPVALTRALISLDTAGGGEERAAHLVGDILAAAGARVTYHEFSPGRVSLVAHVGDTRNAPLVLSGHLDTVPVGTTPWGVDPLAGDIINGRVTGRGASDMKSGVAALVVALERHLMGTPDPRGVLLILSAAEESGCQGVQHLVEHVTLPGGGPLLVAEPTGNTIATGHKGALWLRVSAAGVAAHGSRPDLGRSAITPLARLAVALADEGIPGSHAAMGHITVNVGTFTGGVQTNLVPDAAEMMLDIRLVPGVSSAEAIAHVRSLAHADVSIATVLDRAPVYSPPDAPFASLVTEVAGVPHREPLTYFTDASVLAEVLGCTETVFLGPGDAEAAHTVDESCPVDRVTAATAVYQQILASR